MPKSIQVVVRELATNANVLAAQGTYPFKFSIPRTGPLMDMELVIYNPGKAANTMYVRRLALESGGLSPFSDCYGIEAQKFAKFITGAEIGTSAAAGNAQMLDNIVPNSGQAVGANACYFRYPFYFGRFPGDTEYALNIPALKNDPEFTAEIVLGGADLDAAPQMYIAARYLVEGATPAKFCRTMHLTNEQTGTGDFDYKMPQDTGREYTHLMATYTAVTTADVGVHGIYADGGQTPLVAGRFMFIKAQNRSDFRIPVAEIEAIGTASTYGVYWRPEPIDSKSYNDLYFKSRRGTTTTLTNLTAREYMPNPGL